MKGNQVYLVIIGTRPEAVKMAPVILELLMTPDVGVKVCVTAQHREMLDQVLNLFEIQPDIDLNLMKPGQSLAAITAAIFSSLDEVIKSIKPDWVLVQGDTTTVMAAALLAFYNQVKVGHVEAGLRTGNKWQPFPEEINRRVAGVVADLHFAPTEWARENLLREGVPESQVIVTGNPVIDAVQIVSERSETAETQALIDQLGLSDHAKSVLPKIILVTAHRRENFGAPLLNIIAAIKEISAAYRESVRIVYPVHLNPNIKKPVHELLSGIPNVDLLPPLDYFPMMHLLKRAYLVLTDSGGLQEEAPGLGVPVLVLRDVTERPEGIEAGTVRLVGTDKKTIVNETVRLLEDVSAYQEMARSVNPYGDGNAAKRIVEALRAAE